MPSVAKSPEREAEIPTTPQWRAMMKAAREALGLSQTEVARAVGVSQAMVSGIERGSSGGSSAVLAICKLLHIAPPVAGLPADVERLVVAALTLKVRSPERYSAILDTIEALAGLDSEKGKPH
jgi:transcriptional regulator with XRE-family HTH domain